MSSEGPPEKKKGPRLVWNNPEPVKSTIDFYLNNDTIDAVGLIDDVRQMQIDAARAILETYSRKVGFSDEQVGIWVVNTLSENELTSLIMQWINQPRGSGDLDETKVYAYAREYLDRIARGIIR